MLRLLVVLACVAVALAVECEPCDPGQCAVATDCYAGVVMDLCNCCAVCGKREGEECDDPQQNIKKKLRGDGRCGENLDCQVVKTNQKKGNKRAALCVCKETDMVCGSDGNTYGNLCQLMEVSYKNGTADAPKVQKWGPCETAPVIASGPKHAHEQLGDKVVIDCEVRGFPIPVITWEKTGEDGRVVRLPGDREDMAIQTRGGPDKLMVTGWVQIVDLKPSDSGTYTCIATNEKGETRADARVGVYKATKGEL